MAIYAGLWTRLSVWVRPRIIAIVIIIIWIMIISGVVPGVSSTSAATCTHTRWIAVWVVMRVRRLRREMIVRARISWQVLSCLLCQLLLLSHQLLLLCLNLLQLLLQSELFNHQICQLTLGTSVCNMNLLWGVFTTSCGLHKHVIWLLGSIVVNVAIFRHSVQRWNNWAKSLRWKVFGVLFCDIKVTKKKMELGKYYTFMNPCLILRAGNLDFPLKKSCFF